MRFGAWGTVDRMMAMGSSLVVISRVAVKLSVRMDGCPTRDKLLFFWSLVCWKLPPKLAK